MRRWTIYILIVIAALLIAWDIYAYVVGGDQATISIVVRDWAQTYPTIPFVLGVLAGHVLWPLRGKR